MLAGDLLKAEEIYAIAFQRDNAAISPLAADPANIIFPLIEKEGQSCLLGGAWLLQHYGADAEIMTAAVSPAISPYNQLALFLHFETSAAILNPIETAKAVACAVDICGDDKELFSILQFLNLPPNQFTARRYSGLLQLEQEWLLMLARGSVSTSSGFTVGEWTQEERKALLALWSQLDLTERMQAQLLEGIRDLINRTGDSCSRILTVLQEGINCGDSDIQPRAHADKIMTRLKELLNPRLAQDLEQFNKNARSAGFTNGLHIKPAGGFEQNGIAVAFSADSLKAYNAAVKRLASIETDTLTDLIYPFRKDTAE